MNKRSEEYMQIKGGFFKTIQEIGLKNESLLLGVLYTIMHAGILFLPNAVFWDDWVLYRTDPNVVLDTFRQAGSMFNITGYLHVAMLGMGLWSYKAFTFLLMFAAGLLLNSILKRNSLLSREMRFFVVLLFLILPFNMARVAIINFPYVLRYFVFFLAWFLIWKNRPFSLVLFFLSFNTNSLLVFYVLPMLEIAYRDGFFGGWKTFFKKMACRIDFIIIPFVFFAIKTIYFVPSGLYEGYNQNYGFENLNALLDWQMRDLKKVEINFYILILALPVVWLLLGNHLRSTRNDRPLVLLGALFLGILAVILAEFPYLIVGRVPGFSGWESRHQLLFPFGTALIFTAVLFSLKKIIRNLGLLVIVAASISYGIQAYYYFYVDWSKQEELIVEFSKNSDIKKSDLIVVKDHSIDKNAMRRMYSFYEWNGLLEKAYGNQKHFSIHREDVPKYLNGDFDMFFSSHYKSAEFHRDQSTVAVFVEIKKREEKYTENIISALFPRFDLSVQPINIEEFRQPKKD